MNTRFMIWFKISEKFVFIEKTNQNKGRPIRYNYVIMKLKQRRELIELNFQAVKMKIFVIQLLAKKISDSKTESKDEVFCYKKNTQMYEPSY